MAKKQYIQPMAMPICALPSTRMMLESTEKISFDPETYTEDAFSNQYGGDKSSLWEE